MKRLEELKVEILSFLRDFLGASLPDLASIEQDKSLYYKAALDKIQFQVLPHTEYLNNHVTVVLDNHALKIQNEAINYVVGILEGYKREDLIGLSHVIENPRDRSVVLVGYVPAVEIPGEGEYYDDGSVGVNYTKLDNRFEGLMHFMYKEFEFISNSLRMAATQYCGDVTKIKTDDIVLRLNTRKPGEETAFFFTVTRVPHTFDPTTPIEPVMTPMTEEDKRDLFDYLSNNEEKIEAGITIEKDIDAALDRINAQINSFVNCEEAVLYRNCNDYAITLVNTVLIPTVVTIQLQPFSTFGGTYEQLVKEEGETPNSEACLAVIDTVLCDLWNMLEAAEAQNDNFDISYFALDTDSFGVYGMSEEGKPIHTVISGAYTFRNAIERFHTASFIEIFKRYLKTVKNKRVFTHQGTIDPESIRVTPKVDDTDTSVTE